MADNDCPKWSDKADSPRSDTSICSALGGTGRGITNRPPPPKHKNSPDVNVGELTRFSQLDERRERARRAGEDADSDIAEAMLAIARVRRLLCVTEEQSDLGREAHIDAVLRRIRCREPGAFLLDEHHVLTEAAHEEELAMAKRTRRNRG